MPSARICADTSALSFVPAMYRSSKWGRAQWWGGTPEMKLWSRKCSGRMMRGSHRIYRTRNWNLLKPPISWRMSSNLIAESEMSYQIDLIFFFVPNVCSTHPSESRSSWCNLLCSGETLGLVCSERRAEDMWNSDLLYVIITLFPLMLFMACMRHKKVFVLVSSIKRRVPGLKSSLSLTWLAGERKQKIHWFHNDLFWVENTKRDFSMNGEKPFSSFCCKIWLI